MRWDPMRYVQYSDERGRPFLDLISRIEADDPRRVVDLGCGPGNLTALLARRWPSASIEGIDSSAEMIDAASGHASATVRFSVGAVEDWQMSDDVDVLVSNATLQWVPRHRELLREWSAALPPGAWLAFQVPGNFRAPSHRLMREIAQTPRWRARLDGVLRHEDAVDDAAGYAQLLMSAGLHPDVWETTYLHVLPGADPVLDWVSGTGLRPILAALGDDAAGFTAEYRDALREAYPPGPHGTIFPFRRIFAVAHRSRS